MARFAFIIPPFLGHINSTLSVGAELLNQGHKVFWFSVITLPDAIIPHGGEQVLLELEAKKKENVEENENKKYFGMNSLINLYDNVLVPLNRFMYKCLENCIDQYNIDIIVNDQQAFSGAFIALKKNIPYASFVTAPAAIIPSVNFPKVIEWETEQVIKLQEELGIFSKNSLVCSEELTIVFSSVEFIGNSNFPENFKFVGPALTNRSLTSNFDLSILRQTKLPKILVTIGSILKDEKDFFEKIIESFGDQLFTVVVVADPKLFDKWPNNFIVKEFIPQIEVLPLVDAVICHGGHNTVCEAIYYKKPLIVIPMVNDQSLVATQVLNSGCGIRLKLKRLSVSTLQKSLNDLLNNMGYKKSVIEISNSFKKGGGTKQVVDYLLRLIAKKEKSSFKLLRHG